MYVPEGHNGVSAGAVSKLSGCTVQRQDEEQRKRGENTTRWAHLWIILANCVHFSLHSTLELSSKHKEEIRSVAAMLFY